MAPKIAIRMLAQAQIVSVPKARLALRSHIRPDRNPRFCPQAVHRRFYGSSAKPESAIRVAASASPPASQSSISPNTDQTGQDASISKSSIPNPDSTQNKDAHHNVAKAHGQSLTGRFSTSMDNLQARVLVASQTLNDLTGYSAIEDIKADVARLEKALEQAQERLRVARQNYKLRTAHRAATQRETTTLLARKDAWTPLDVERFTTLYKLDHELETGVAAAAGELTEAEQEESRLSAQLNAGILKRYHEEQVWSDRIRRQSTWGTWGLMGVNIVLFIVLQFVAEPWRRERLVKGVIEEESRVLESVRGELAEVKAALKQVRAAAVPEAAFVAPDKDTKPVALNFTLAKVQATWREILVDPAKLKAALVDLYSERRIDWRMRDASRLALEGAAAGAALAIALAAVALRRN